MHSQQPKPPKSQPQATHMSPNMPANARPTVPQPWVKPTFEQLALNDALHSNPLFAPDGATDS